MNSWDTLLMQWERHQIAIAVPPTTRGLRLYYLHRLSLRFPSGPQEVTFEGLIDWLADHTWALNTRRTVRTSLRAFWTWLMATGRAETSPVHQLPGIRAPRPKPRPTPEEAYHEGLANSLPREQLMIRLAAVCGLRRGEIARIHTDDISSDLDGHALRVKGKGGHERWVPLTAQLAGELRALPRGWVFPSKQSKSGHLEADRVGKLVAIALPANWTCHTLRHRCASVAYAAEKDLRAVQELLGHASPDTTAIYVAVPDGAIRRAVEAAAA